MSWSCGGRDSFRGGVSAVTEAGIEISLRRDSYCAFFGEEASGVRC